MSVGYTPSCSNIALISNYTCLPCNCSSEKNSTSTFALSCCLSPSLSISLSHSIFLTRVCQSSHFVLETSLPINLFWINELRSSLFLTLSLSSPFQFLTAFFSFLCQFINGTLSPCDCDITCCSFGELLLPNVSKGPIFSDELQYFRYEHSSLTNLNV